MKSLNFSEYKKIVHMTHNEFCRWLEDVVEKAKETTIEIAIQEAKKQVFGGDDVTAYVFDEDQFLGVLNGIEGVSEDLADRILQELEEHTSRS